MNPLSLIAAPLAFGLRQAGRGLQLIAGVLEQQAGRAQDQAEQSQAQSEVEPQRQKSSRQPKSLDDVSITRKVETEIFRDKGVPKGSIDVNTADGVVWLRGEAKSPEMINQLEQRASEIPEVVRVENLLHPPKTPAPSRADTPRRQQKTRRSKPSQNQRRTTTRVTAEKRSSTAGEPTPKQVARQRRGRQSAPLGDDGDGAGKDGGR